MVIKFPPVNLFLKILVESILEVISLLNPIVLFVFGILVFVANLTIIICGDVSFPR